MRHLTRGYPYFLMGVFLFLMLVAVVLNDGAGAASERPTKYVMEPRGPKPKLLFPPPRDFQNLGSALERRKARQEVAHQKYRMLARSYLRWNKRNVGAPGTTVILQPVRFRCKGTNSVMPRNWCWYANAMRWTEREIAETAKRILDRRTLADTNDWQTAVRIVQRVYPGTESWLLSCSAAEGGHGRWVWYGGRSWTGGHIGNDYLGMDTVGGQMQFRWSTFKPYWYGYWGARGALADTRARGFVVPNMGSGYGPWLRPLGQALTAAYMRYTGRSGHHWSASHGNGC